MTMRKNWILIITISILCFGCSDNNNVNILLDGSTFTRTSYIIDTPVDGNSDGIFSNDLMLENFCFDLSLGFNESTTTSIPTNDVFLLNVVDDGNGNLNQQLNCAHGDGPGMDYVIKENIIEFYRNDELRYSGEISSDGNTITIHLDSEHLFAFTLWFDPQNQILNQDGSITNYVGDATVIYTRQ